MKKSYIQKVVEYNGPDREIKAEANRVADILFAIPDSEDMGAMMSVQTFEKDGAFDMFVYEDSKIYDQDVKDDAKSRIIGELKSIFLEVASWIQNNPMVVKYNILTADKRKVSRRRWIVIAILAVIAIASIVLTALRYTTNLIGEAPVGEIIGLVDLVLGIFGFIYEVADDGKRDDMCNAVEDMSESKSNAALDKQTEKLLKAKKRSVIVKIIFALVYIDNSEHVYDSDEEDTNEQEG